MRRQLKAMLFHRCPLPIRNHIPAMCNIVDELLDRQILFNPRKIHLPLFGIEVELASVAIKLRAGCGGFSDWIDKNQTIKL